MEVDFVLYGEKGIRAFEIKCTGKLSSSMLSCLKSFLRDYPMTKSYFICGRKRRMSDNNIEIVPVHEELQNLGDILS